MRLITVRNYFFILSLFSILCLYVPFATCSSEDESTVDDKDLKKGLSSHYLLSDRNKMPKIGLGVYRMKPGKETYEAVLAALQVGYRLIDTAAFYKNEADVGRAISDSGIGREEVFITTKLETTSHGYDNAIRAAEESLKKLNTTYIDLLLIHSPTGKKIVETYDALIQLQKDGKVKSIGVSNFGIHHLEVLHEYGRPLPTVNQIEMHPLIYHPRLELVNYCKKKRIRITAYGSLFGGKINTDYQHDTLLNYLARQYKKTVSQILLRWAIELGFAVIPKSSSTNERLEENLNILDFKIAHEEINAISEMMGPPLNEYWDPVNDLEIDIGDTSHFDTGKEEL